MKKGDLVYKHGLDKYYNQERDGWIIRPTFYIVNRVTKATAFLLPIEAHETVGGFLPAKPYSSPVILGSGELKVKLQSGKRDYRDEVRKEYVTCEDLFTPVPVQFKARVVF